MSKHMQLKVIVNPYYQKDMQKVYPKLVKHLEYQDPDLAGRNPSLYELAGMVDQLLYKFDGTPLREVFFKYKDKLQKAYYAIEESIADWKLAQADKLLYNIEDIFDEIEFQLD
jgi:hypothetical protein